MRLLPRWSFKTWLRIWGGLFAAGAVTALAGAAFVAVYVIRVTEDLPTVETLRDYRPPVMTRVHAGDGKLIAEYARQSRVFVPIETIPEELVQAFISAEDKNFYTHNGVDYAGVFKAQLRNALNCLRSACSSHGGSSITQQVAKNFLLSPRQTIERKVREAALAHRMETVYTKDTILELYLNEIYLGRRSYGVAAASLLYFGKSLDELSLSEMAYLAALPKAPSTLDITRDKARPRARARRDYVLERMVANGYITADKANVASAQPLQVAERLSGTAYRSSEYFVEEVRRLVFGIYGEDELYDGGLSIRTTLDTTLQIAARNALRDGLETYDRRRGYRGPVATIELNAQWQEALANVTIPPDIEDWFPAVVLRTADQAVEIGLIDGKKAVIPLEELTWARRVDEEGQRGPEIEKASQALFPGEVILASLETRPADEEAGLPERDVIALNQIPDANGGLIAMDPHTGRILAMMGGYSFRHSQFNRVTQARRQPGSAFKPFVYAAALEAGKTPVYKVLDAPYVSCNRPGEPCYKPKNYTGRWYNLSTLRLGIEKSRNAMTVRLANDIGLERMSEIGERFGIYDSLPPYEAMSLGAGETTLWRMAAAYAMLVNGGREVSPTIIDRVQDRDGRTIYVHDTRECEGCMVDDWRIVAGQEDEPQLPDDRAQIVSPVTAYQIVSMLEGVVERGTARSIQAVGKPLGGKTGTTNDFRDAWFMGFSPDLVVGIYIGLDTPVPLGEGESGGTVAAPVFRDFMAAALSDKPSTPFRIPPGVRLVRVEPRTGDLARPGDPEAILEAFVPGTEPTRYAASTDASWSGYVEPRRGGISFGGGRTETPSVNGAAGAPGPEGASNDLSWMNDVFGGGEAGRQAGQTPTAGGGAPVGASGSLYDAPTPYSAPSPYDAPPATSPYGEPSPYGQPAQPSGEASPYDTPYGQTAPDLYGQPQTGVGLRPDLTPEPDAEGEDESLSGLY